MAKTLTVTRIFEAPVEMVWKAWSEPEMIMKWWGPKYFTSPLCKLDFREGGISIVGMRSPQGQDFYNSWTYTKIQPMQQIEFIQKLTDKDGNVIDPTSVGMPADFPKDIRTVVTLENIGDKVIGDMTKMTVTEYLPETPMYNYAEIGLNQSLDKMGEALTQLKVKN